MSCGGLIMAHPVPPRSERQPVHGLSALSRQDGPMRELNPDEAFRIRFLARIPADLANSFTPDQLAAIQRAFGTRYAMEHTVDVRRTVTLPWGRFYLVLLGGRDRRREHRRRQASLRGWLLLAGAALSAVVWLAL
jgi:hypothetical protein